MTDLIRTNYGNDRSLVLVGRGGVELHGLTYDKSPHVSIEMSWEEFDAFVSHVNDKKIGVRPE